MISKIATSCLLLLVLLSCAPKLNISQIEKKINKHYTALFDGDVEYRVYNTPKKSLKAYGEYASRNYFQKVYDNRTYPVHYGNIGELVVEIINKCNSYYYYKVNYIVDESQMTPYLDSTTLKRNKVKYGHENVSFNSNSRILHIRQRKSKILVFDKDRIWKILDYNLKYLNDNYGKTFSDCIGQN